jgi:TatD DNase family protein
MQLFETHFHLDPDDDATAILQRARNAGVAWFLTVASDLADAERLAEIAATEENVFSTAGIHPHVAEKHDGDLTRFRELAARQCIRAIGEIGLDYHYEFSPREQQQILFRQFLELAAELKLPAIVHCREAYDDCLAILEDALQPGQSFVVHSYTGPASYAPRFHELGAHFSFNGIVTFKKAENVREALRAVPLDRLLLETDAPYLAPIPHRGHRNEPAYLPHIAAKVAEVKGVSTEEIARITTTNARQLFNVQLPGQ